MSEIFYTLRATGQSMADLNDADVTPYLATVVSRFGTYKRDKTELVGQRPQTDVLFSSELKADDVVIELTNALKDQPSSTYPRTINVELFEGLNPQPVHAIDIGYPT